jgi:hypothetical protein
MIDGDSTACTKQNENETNLKQGALIVEAFKPSAICARLTCRRRVPKSRGKKTGQTSRRANQMKSKTTFKAVFLAQGDNGFNGKQLIVTTGNSAANVASNLAWRALGAVAFGGYVGDLEIQINRVREDRDGEKHVALESVWYARFRSDGTYWTAQMLDELKVA